jgi:hypothetical protein
MTTLPHAVAGDINDFRNVILAGIQDLDTVDELEAHIWQHNVDPVTLAATVADSAERTIRVELGDATGWLAVDATVGSWLIEYQLTFLDGTVLTWPQHRPDVLPVRAQGDPPTP